MPGIFGMLAKDNSVQTGQFLATAGEYLRLYSHYCYQDLSTERYVAGISVPYDLDGIGPDYNAATDVVVNLDGRIDYFLNDSGNRISVETGSEHAVILELYSRYRESLPKYLSGVYNIAIYDCSENYFLVFSDILANRLLYYYDDEHVFIYGSELKTFLAHPGFKSVADNHSVADIINYGRVWGNRTLLQNVKLLEPGKCLVVDMDGVRGHEYFTQKRTIGREDCTREDLVTEGWDLLNQSIDRCLIRKKSISITLTAGLDSRLLLAVVNERDIDVTAFTHADIDSSMEFTIAQLVAQSLGVSDHRLLRISADIAGRIIPWSVWLNDGMELAPCSYILDTASQMSKVTDGLLNGIYGGHNSFSDGFYRPSLDRTDLGFEQRLAELAKIAPARGRRITNGPPPSGVFKKDYSENLYGLAKTSMETELRMYEKLSDNLAEQLNTFIRRILLRRMMNRVDVNRFIFRDEAPFGDSDLLRYHLSIPLSKLEGNWLYLAIYKKYFPKLVELPTYHTGEGGIRKRLDQLSAPKTGPWRKVYSKAMYYLERATRGKYCFEDRYYYRHYDQWYCKSAILRNAIEEIVLDDRTQSRLNLDPRVVDSYVKKQRSGGKLYSTLIKIVQLELFFRYFIDRDRPPRTVIT